MTFKQLKKIITLRKELDFNILIFMEQEHENEKQLEPNYCTWVCGANFALWNGTSSTDCPVRKWKFIGELSPCCHFLSLVYFSVLVLYKCYIRLKYPDSVGLSYFTGFILNYNTSA